ncbi:MAG: hypothetical protein AB9834_06280 [Lentimicrobium sp.]
METIENGFKGLMGKVAAAIDDLASLEVTTYSGSFSFKMNDIVEGPDNAFKIKSLLKTPQAALTADLYLVAYSRFEIDADASNIVRNNLTTDDRVLLEAHTELVKAAQESRKAVFELAKSLLKLPL